MNHGTKNTDREKWINDFRGARADLLLLIIFTAVNIVMAIVGDGTYMLFTAFIPYILTFYGMFYSGNLPDEYYSEPGIVFDSGFLAPMIIAAVIITLMYFACWFFAKNRRATWLVVALVLFSIDTLLMIFLGGINTSMLIDYAFHAFIIFFLARGIIAAKKLEALPDEAAEETPAETVYGAWDNDENIVSDETADLTDTSIGEDENE